MVFIDILKYYLIFINIKNFIFSSYKYFNFFNFYKYYHLTMLANDRNIILKKKEKNENKNENNLYL